MRPDPRPDALEGTAASPDGGGGWLFNAASAFLLVNSLWILYTVYAIGSPGVGMGALVLGYIVYLTAIPHVIAFVLVAVRIGDVGLRGAPGQAFVLAIGLVAPLAFVHSLGGFEDKPDRLRAYREAGARFAAEQRERPFGEDQEMLALVAALQNRGRADDGWRLRSAVERRTLKAVLGETYPAPRTVGQAMDAEASVREPIAPLRQRVAGAVTVRAIPNSAGQLDANHPSEVRWRWVARNGTRVPVASLNILLSRWTQLYGDKMLLLCQPETGEPIAPAADAAVVCAPWAGTPSAMSEKARAMLQDAAMAHPRPATYIALANLGFGISADNVSFGDRECELTRRPAGLEPCRLP